MKNYMKIKVLFAADRNEDLYWYVLSGMRKDCDYRFLPASDDPSNAVKEYSPDIAVIATDQGIAALKRHIGKLRSENPELPCIVLSDNDRALALSHQVEGSLCVVLPRRGTSGKTLTALARQMTSWKEEYKKSRSAMKNRKAVRSIPVLKTKLKSKKTADADDKTVEISAVSEKQNRFLIENFSGYILEIDNEGRIILVNRVVPGLKKNEVIGTSVFRYVPEENHEILKEFLRQDPKKRKITYFEFKGNEIIRGMWMSVKVVPLKHPPKNDISEAKAWEQELQKRFEYERTISDCLKILSGSEKLETTFQRIVEILLASVNVSRVYIFENYESGNDGLCTRQIKEATMTGIEPVINHPDLAYLQYKKIPRGIFKKLSSNKPYSSVQSKFTSDEKELFDFQGILSILNIPIYVNNKFWGFIGFDDCLQERIWKSADILLLKTIADLMGHFIERNASEEALRKSEEKYRAVAETSVTGIGIVNAEETFVWVNKAFADMLGWSVDELIGTNLLAISEQNEYKKYIEKTSEKRIGKRHNYESKLFRKDGSLIDIFVHSSPLTKADGGFEGTLAVVIDITASKKAMELLKQSEKRYKDLILTLNEGILIVNKDGEIIFANPVIADLLDYEVDEILGQNISDFVEKDYHLVINKILGLHKSNKARSFEIELKNKSGEKIYTYFSISRIESDGAGNPALLAGIIDITSLKTAENELKKLDFQLQDRVKELNGLYTLEELNRKSDNIDGLFKIFANEIAPSSMGFPEDTVACLNINGTEYKNIADPGLKNPVSYPIKANGQEKGRLTIGYSSGVMSISENEIRLIQQYAERLGTIIESRENQEALSVRSRAIETSVSAFAFADMDGNFTYVNPSFVQLWSFDSEDEIIGKPVSQYFQPGIPFAGMFDQLKRDNFWMGELTARKKDDSFFTVHVSANFMKDKEGKPVSMMASFIDITELKKLQEQLIQSERLAATGELVASIAHEINSPLQAINFLLVSLGKKCVDDSSVKSDVELLMNAFGRIRDTVKDLLNLNRPGREKKQITNINRLISNTVDLSSSYLKGRKIEIDCTLLPDIPDIVASPQHLSQVFLNLINNSVEAITGSSIGKRWAQRTPVSGKICINSFMRNGFITVIFEDTGPGIPQEDIKHIFDPFFTKKKKMGMGVGLSVCYNIIKEHRGTIEAENKSEGGAKFTIKLPSDFQF
jgi:PAS domain S-box-containing protein